MVKLTTHRRLGPSDVNSCYMHTPFVEKGNERPSFSCRFVHASFFTCRKWTVRQDSGRQLLPHEPFILCTLYKKPMKSNIVIRDCLLGLGSCHGSRGQPLTSVSERLGSVRKQSVWYLFWKQLDWLILNETDWYWLIAGVHPDFLFEGDWHCGYLKFMCDFKNVIKLCLLHNCNGMLFVY